jgi:hypothetical protein
MKAAKSRHGACEPHHQIAAGGLEHADDGEILRGVIGQVADRADIGGMRAGGDEQQRIAVRLRRLDGHRPDDAVGPWAVVDHDRLSGPLFELFADHPRGDVAGAERHDDLDWTRRISIGPGDGGRERTGRESKRSTAVQRVIDCQPPPASGVPAVAVLVFLA